MYIQEKQWEHRTVGNAGAMGHGIAAAQHNIFYCSLDYLCESSV